VSDVSCLPCKIRPACVPSRRHSAFAAVRRQCVRYLRQSCFEHVHGGNSDLLLCKMYCSFGRRCIDNLCNVAGGYES
jgi:hypothetical protein